MMNGSNSIRRQRESTSSVLRGTQNGLEIAIGPNVAIDDVADELTARLEQCPEFFAGSEVTVRCDGALPAGALARLEAIATRYQLRIAEAGQATEAAGASRLPKRLFKPVIEAGREHGSSPRLKAPRGVARDPRTSALAEVAKNHVEALKAAASSAAGARLVVGPIRSGGLVESDGHLVVVGDANPGAELRAGGNVIILGALRGIAHAGCNSEGSGFIIALRLDPQQLRIGNLIARTGDSGAPDGTAIAYAADGRIVVETYRGKLPSDVVAGI